MYILKEKNARSNLYSRYLWFSWRIIFLEASPFSLADRWLITIVFYNGSSIWRAYGGCNNYNTFYKISLPHSLLLSFESKEISMSPLVRIFSQACSYMFPIFADFLREDATTQRESATSIISFFPPFLAR